MAQVREIFGKASKALGVPVLTPEYELVLALVDSPDLTAEQLFERSTLSRAGFFNTVERLKTWGIIVANSDVADRRRRIYRLQGDLRQIIFYRFSKYRVDYLDRDACTEPFVTRDLTARRDKGLDYFTCEFKILFYLYLRPEMPNFALRALIDTSESKFHLSLRSLLENGLVTATAGSADRRLKQYAIGCHARTAIQTLHSDLFGWLDTCELIIHPLSHSPVPQATTSEQASSQTSHCRV